MTIKEIKSIWDTEQNEYRKHEIGSGVQDFVNKILMSEEIFNLKKGKLSDDERNRKNEFLLEQTKKQKRADIIIYVDNEIIIPVEVEKYKNIKAGKEQIFNYQKAWNKKYGILTDGYTWIFYNNKIEVRQFTLDFIFNKTELFLKFWEEYTLADNYYLQFFELSKDTNNYEQSLNIDENKKDFFDDITKLITGFSKKLNLKGYFKELPETEKERKAVEITYAYFIQFILYKTLADNEFENFGTDFSQRLDRITINIKNKTYGDILSVIKSISTIISKNIYKPFIKEQELINDTLDNLLIKAQNDIKDISVWLDIFVFIKKYNFANIQNEIFGYIYENYLKQLYANENKGQYFTPPEVVDFMLEELGYSQKKLAEKNNNEISIIDPSCGSGTFLYSAVRNIINSKKTESFKTLETLISKNIFGLDVEEFPLYLAEMSIIMRMLPIITEQKYNNPIDKRIQIFKTKDSISEFQDVALKNTLTDIEQDYKNNQNQLNLFTDELNLGYTSYIRNEDDLKGLKSSLENNEEPRINRYRFDYVVGNPPYIGYNQCARQDIQFFVWLRKKKVKLNDVYGINLHSIPNYPKRYRPNPNLYAFFVALGIALLKDKGRLAYIIPRTLLFAGDLDTLRYHLSKFVTIRKIIISTSNMFVDRGLKQNKPVATSSLIIFIEKIPPAKLHETEIIYYKSTNDDVKTVIKNIKNNKNIVKNKILQNTLSKNVTNWNYIIHPKEEIKFLMDYKRQFEDFSTYYLHDFSKLDFSSVFYFDSGYAIDERNKLLEKPQNEDNYYFFPKLPAKNYTITQNRGFWKNERKNINDKHFIKLRQANQGYNLLDSTYKILWSYSNPKRFYFTNKKVIWPRNQINAIGSENLNEIYYLFAILNSPITNFILQKLLKSEHEKNLQISTSSVKKFVKLPKITDFNRNIKEKVIKLTEEFIKTENNKLSDYVNFDNFLIQKFDNVIVQDNQLIICKNEKKYKFEISNKAEIITEKIEKITTRSVLKDLQIIDYEEQAQVKKQIDNLIFTLYFNTKDDKKLIENYCCLIKK